MHVQLRVWARQPLGRLTSLSILGDNHGSVKKIHG